MVVRIGCSDTVIRRRCMPADALPVRALPRRLRSCVGLSESVSPSPSGRSERGEILGFRFCIWAKPRRGGNFPPQEYSKPIYFSALMVELYTGLSSFYEIFNPWEMNLNMVRSTSLY